MQDQLHQLCVNHLVLMIAVKITHTTKSQSDTPLNSKCFCCDSVPVLLCLYLFSLLVCFHNVLMTPGSHGRRGGDDGNFCEKELYYETGRIIQNVRQ